MAKGSLPEKTGNPQGALDVNADLEQALLEQMEAFKILEQRISEIETRMERMKTFLSGGEVNGEKVNGVQQHLGFIKERLDEVERAVMSRELGVPTSLPRDLYQGLTAAELFKTLLAAGFQATATSYPQVVIGRSDQGARDARLADLIKACHHCVVTIAKQMPDMLKAEAK